MKHRGTRVHARIAALLVSLVALWAFAAYVTVASGLHLWFLSAVQDGLRQPTDTLVTALQTERRLATEVVGARAAGAAGPREALTAARAATDRARAELAASAASTKIRWARTPELGARVDALLAGVDELSGVRAAVDASTTRAQTLAAYGAAIEQAMRVYDELGGYAAQVAGDGRTLTTLARARELLAREDALLSGALAAGGLTGAETTAFARLAGAWHAYEADASAHLSGADLARYDQVAAGAGMADLLRYEAAVADRALGAAPAGEGVPAAPAVTARQWRDAVDSTSTQLGRTGAGLVASMLGRARPHAIGAIVALVVVVELGLVAVIASIVVSVSTVRRLLRQLRALRAAADDLATRRLPAVVDRLRLGGVVDVQAEAPPLDAGGGPVGEVGQAFNRVQETAIRTAVEQAELRRGVHDLFLGLARRSQTLLHRQLGLLDAMERRAGTPDELAELFRVDHLATRMRRNAENLIVLSGATAGRTWRKPVPMVDVLRGALAEVEDFTRVTVVPPGPAALIGPAVGDVIHLLAELVENAVSFSPPQTTVRMSGAATEEGFVIEVEDRGLGMTDEQRVAANAHLADPPEFALSGTARLGLYVVGRLAQRHGVRVRLNASPYGGTTAVVVLPAELVTDPAAVPAPGRAATDGEFAPVGAGRTMGGPIRSEPASVNVAGLPVRRRPAAAEGTAVQSGPAANRPTGAGPANVGPGSAGPARPTGAPGGQPNGDATPRDHPQWIQGQLPT